MTMRWDHAMFWGFAATILLTTMLSACRGLGLTRMDIPFLVGTMFTADRDKARWLGFLVHLFNGWVFALIYIWAMLATGLKHWWFGMSIGLVHSMFLLVVGMTILPSVHPRMATEQYGPDPTRQLEPPGFMALNYGRQTPVATLFAHMIFGTALGLFYP